MSFETAAITLAWVSILLLALGVSGLLRRIHVLEVGAAPTRRSGLPTGIEAPALADVDVRGRVLLFADKGCQSCHRLLEHISRSEDTDRLLVVVRDVPEEPVTVQSPEVIIEPRAFEAYRVGAVPAVVAVDVKGRIQGTALVGSIQLFDEFLEGLLPTG